MSQATHEWRGRAVWGVLVGFTLVRLGLAIFDQYPYWPDEVYQALEPAHRAAFGYGFRAWEFVDGARSYLVPGVFAGIWKLAAAVGVHEGLWLVWIAKVLVTLLSSAALWSAMSLAGRRGGRSAALLAGIAVSLLPILFVTWHRTLSEPISASVALCAAALLDRPGGGRRAFLGGLVAGLGVFVRYQAGLFLITFLFLPLLDKRLRDAGLYVAGAALAGVLGGALDWITWGKPFHSFLTYVEFNFVQDGAIFFGAEPWWFYFDRLWAAGGPAAALLAVGFLVGLRRAPVLGLTAIAFTLAHSSTPHKELRFIIPALAVAAVPSALGLVDLGRWLGRALPLRWRGPTGGLAMAALTGVLGWRAALLSWKEVGIRPPPPRAAPDDPILLHNRDTNVAISWVGQRRDACGVIVRARAPIWTGGYAYLHRDIPFFFRDTGDNRRMANYVIAPDTKEPIGFFYHRVARVGKSIIYRRPGACEVPEGWEPPIASDRPAVDAIEEARRDQGL